jgi:hypothetical protein
MEVGQPGGRLTIGSVLRRFLGRFLQFHDLSPHQRKVVGGALLVDAPLEGWHHYLGEAMVYVGILGAILASVGAWRRDSGRH